MKNSLDKTHVGFVTNTQTAEEEEERARVVSLLLESQLQAAAGQEHTYI